MGNSSSSSPSPQVASDQAPAGQQQGSTAAAANTTDAEPSGRNNILAQIATVTDPLHKQQLEEHLVRYDQGFDSTAGLSRLETCQTWYTYREWYDVYSVEKNSEMGRRFERLKGEEEKKRFLRTHATNIWEIGADAARDPTHPLH